MTATMPAHLARLSPRSLQYIFAIAGLVHAAIIGTALIVGLFPLSHTLTLIAVLALVVVTVAYLVLVTRTGHRHLPLRN